MTMRPPSWTWTCNTLLAEANWAKLIADALTNLIMFKSER